MEKRQLKTSVLVTLSSFLGIVLGAGLQYFFSLQTQQAKLWSDLRTNAYVAFIENSTKASMLEDPTKRQEAIALRNSARFAIGLYGSRAVVEKMARYAPLEDTGSKDMEKATLELFDAMRNELVPGGEKVSPDLLSPILFPSRAGPATAK